MNTSFSTRSLSFLLFVMNRSPPGSSRTDTLSPCTPLFRSPLYVRPRSRGDDLGLHAATRYLVGHLDAMLGVVVRGEAHYERLRRTGQFLGCAAAPDDLYLGLRGLRTLAVRLERHQANALKLAEWLDQRPEVNRLLYPALPSDPGHAIWRRDFAGASGLFGLTLKPCRQEAAAALVDSVELFGIGASRSDERRVGKGEVRMCRSRVSTFH